MATCLAHLFPVWERKWFRLFMIALTLIGSALGIAAFFSASPPILTFAQSRTALSLARHAEAGVYAPELLFAAEQSWEQARLAWRRENDKWFIRRDFTSPQHLALLARQQAQAAQARSSAVRDSLQWVAAAGIALLKQSIAERREQFKNLPIAGVPWQRFVTGEMLIRESELAFNRGDYWRAVAKYHEAARRVGGAIDDVTKILQDYLSRVAEWQQWAAETINWSAQENKAAIIVDKMARCCYLYVNGHLQGKYEAEFGPRWLGHKTQKGDGATPEGRYYVTVKKGLGQSPYHKALEINYPNESDRQQFLAAQKNGKLSRSAHIGGSIQIHGHGGKGVNWTAGCVALKNEDMDQIFELTSIGTPVTIVGSLKSLTSHHEGLRQFAGKSVESAAPRGPAQLKE
ncbi:MAG: L,D-transpeptidase family protein [candidate division KSB1 bacterium]|nr:L,D-transpeptidase family protein [candidate division KSB1 bacterium]